MPTTERLTAQEIREAFGVETRVEMGYDRAGLEMEYIQNFGKDPADVRAAVLAALTPPAPPPERVRELESELHAIDMAFGNPLALDGLNRVEKAAKCVRMLAALNAPAALASQAAPPSAEPSPLEPFDFTEWRDLVIEECAKVCEKLMHGCEIRDGEKCHSADARHIRALASSSSPGVPAKTTALSESEREQILNLVRPVSLLLCDKLEADWRPSSAPTGTTTELERAISLALKAHAGQMSRDDVEPQICHVLRVMAAGRTEDERIVGALHDVLEDSEFTLSGFFPHIIDAVELLTRREPWTYATYIERVASNPLATAVKIHDLHDNIARGAAYPSLVKRYEKALERLGASPASVSPEGTQDVEQNELERLRGFKAHVVQVLGDVMGDLRIMRDSTKGTMFEQIAHELRLRSSLSAPETAGKCTWYDDGDMWRGSCGATWTLNDGTPAENHMSFCPTCGKTLEVSPVPPAAPSEEP